MNKRQFQNAVRLELRRINYVMIHASILQDHASAAVERAREKRLDQILEAGTAIDGKLAALLSA